LRSAASGLPAGTSAGTAAARSAPAITCSPWGHIVVSGCLRACLPTSRPVDTE
jgi:hypothetical protein